MTSPQPPANRPRRIAVVVGNPRPGSRTRAAAETLAASLQAGLAQRGLTAEIATIELAEVAAELFDWASTRVERLVAEVRAADLLIVTSPTYKASITGLLKAFLDRFGADSLLGTVGLPVMLGGVANHALAVEYQLRPVLIEIGASCPTRGLYLLESELEELAERLAPWLAAYQDFLLDAVERARPAAGEPG